MEVMMNEKKVIVEEVDKENNVSPISEEDDDWITLSFDGTLFTTLRSTLLIDKEIARDLSHPSRPYLIDRNPKYFEPILNYLRTGELILDNNINIHGVLSECKYWGISSMIETLEKLIKENEEKKEEKEDECSELTRGDIVKALINIPSGRGMLRFQGLNLTKINLSGLDLSAINFSRSILRNADLSYCTLDYSELRDCNLENCNFTNARMYKTILKGSNCKNIILTGAFLRGALLSHCDLTNADFKGADLESSDLSNSVLKSADLSGANMKGVVLRNSIMTNVVHTSSMGGVIQK
ncbi:hypothetical protein ABK040_010271 [Willaertia magna]